MDKPFKTIEQQTEILESRGMAVDDRTAWVLEREGYYSVVNGYKDPFLDLAATQGTDGDRYQDGTSFSDVHCLFTFDRDLRLTMTRYFAQAEAVLKTVCAYQFAKAHQGEREAFLLTSSYRGERRYRRDVGRLIGDLERILHKSPGSPRLFRRDYIEHYVTNHDEVPIWVLTNFLTLGQAFKFYDYQPESTRNAVAKSFSALYEETHDEEARISPRALRLAYDHIKDFRNICAHDERLYCARVSPSKDVRLDRLIDDLKIVLTREEHDRMRREVASLVIRLANDLDTSHALFVLDAMGLGEVELSFFRECTLSGTEPRFADLLVTDARPVDV